MFTFGPRRAQVIDITGDSHIDAKRLTPEAFDHFETYDLLYRSLCALLYNYVPMSGHPGGSISSGRFVTGILFDAADYELRDPERMDADMVSYAAGHKALGLYAMWALRDEVARQGAPDLLPGDDSQRLRLEDLLGFRRNPVTATPLFRRFKAKALDGHPTPATPFVRLSTGASGVGVPASIGLALGARDIYGKNAPRVHVVEGEGGLTPGRVVEALAAAGTASLDNVILHIDWNQASIDSNHVCRDGDQPGDYVQWDPAELAYLHDWNVVVVPDGTDFRQVVAAQQRALAFDNGQPTAIVYRTIKGWRYGIEGRSSHGAGHGLCSDGFFEAMKPLLGERRSDLPCCCDGEKRCAVHGGETVREACFWDALQLLRQEVTVRAETVAWFCDRLRESTQRLDARARKPRPGAPRLEAIYEMAEEEGGSIPQDLKLEPGQGTTLRGELGRVLGRYNKASNGALFVAAADLLSSTSVDAAAKGFPPGYYHTERNPQARTLSIGGICEDAMTAIMSGLASYGRHIGAGSSYGAFIAPLGHIASRLHAIGNQARAARDGGPYRPMFLVCAHAGLKTGEDGPTHADPQALQLLQGNFPPKTAITLTPWDPQEIWPLVSAALRCRPAFIAPFVTRPKETVPDRAALRLAPPMEAAGGLYLLRAANGRRDGTLMLQESGVTMAFVNEVLPRLDEEGVELDVFYVASAELFDARSAEERASVFPAERAEEAFGITGFTLPTMYRWVTSNEGRALSLHPFAHGHFLGSGQAEMVLREAGLDGEGQYAAVKRYLDARARAKVHAG